MKSKFLNVTRGPSPEISIDFFSSITVLRTSRLVHTLSPLPAHVCPQLTPPCHQALALVPFPPKKSFCNYKTGWRSACMLFVVPCASYCSALKLAPAHSSRHACLQACRPSGLKRSIHLKIFSIWDVLSDSGFQ